MGRREGGKEEGGWVGRREGKEGEEEREEGEGEEEREGSEGRALMYVTIIE